MYKGIDISYVQRGLDLYEAKKAGNKFVIIRAGISLRLDTEFRTHTEGAQKAGLPYGFYWYSRAFSVEDAAAEAKCCIDAVKPYSPVYPVFYDMEDVDQIDRLDRNERTEIIIAFCDAVKSAGYKTGVYLNPSWLENYVDKDRILGRYNLWLAHWTGSPDRETSYRYGQDIWQWGTERIYGMDVDADICYKDYGESPSEGGDENKLLPLGSIVYFLGGKQYRASTADIGVEAKAGKVRISNRAKGTPHPYHVISINDGGGVYGWVSADRIKETDGGRKSDVEIAEEVIAGLWGNGLERKRRLEEAGYDYDRVQREVNRILYE